MRGNMPKPWKNTAPSNNSSTNYSSDNRNNNNTAIGTLYLLVGEEGGDLLEDLLLERVFLGFGLAQRVLQWAVLLAVAQGRVGAVGVQVPAHGVSGCVDM